MTEVTVNEGPQLTVTIEETAGVETVEVSIPGPPGPPGEQGASGDLTYAHTQELAATLWTVTHNLGKYPSVSVVDSGLNEVVGDVQHINVNSLTVEFTAAFSGAAYLN